MLSPDQACAAIASHQYGLITRAQALAVGVTEDQIRYRIGSGRWLIVHPNVFALAGTTVTWERSQLAACLWSGGITAASAAGRVYELNGCENAGTEILVWKGRPPGRSGITIHHTQRLPDSQITSLHGFPITNVERTLMDIAGSRGRRAAAIALDDALRKEMTEIHLLDRCLFLVARRGRRGCGILRDLVSTRAQRVRAPDTPLETIVQEVLDDPILPAPLVQHSIFDENGEFVARPDFLYLPERVIVEAQSYRWHGSKQAWATDMDRISKLTSMGYRIIFVTYYDATYRRTEIVSRVWRTLKEARRTL